MVVDEEEVTEPTDCLDFDELAPIIKRSFAAVPVSRDQSAAGRLEALGLLRYCASWHVVSDHFFHNGDPWGKNSIFSRLFCWGLASVPLFFMLSGFILTYTRLRSRDPDKIDGTFEFLRKRLATIYPIFLFTAVCMAIIKLTIAAGPSETLNVKKIADFTTTVLLVHNWVAEDFFPIDFPFIYVEYFLSCIMVYWLFWGSFYRMVVRRAHLWVLAMAMSFWWVIPLLHRILLLQSYQEPSGFAHDLVHQKFVCHGMLYVFFNVTPFFWGMLLSRVFVDTCTDLASCGERVFKDADSMPWPVRYGASIAFALLAVLFVSHSPWDPFCGVLVLKGEFWKSGGLLPIQGLLVVSLAAGVDPVAKLCMLAPPYLENLSLPQYLLQVPLGNALGWCLARNCDLKVLDSWMIAIFALALVPTSILGHALIVGPFKKVFA